MLQVRRVVYNRTVTRSSVGRAVKWCNTTNAPAAVAQVRILPRDSEYTRQASNLGYAQIVRVFLL